MRHDRRRYWMLRAVAFGMVIWSLLVVAFVERYDVLESDDPFDPGANLAAQAGGAFALMIWLAGMLVGVGMLVVLWRSGASGPRR